MAYTHEEAWQTAQRLRSNLKMQNAISFADVPYPAPDIDYYPDTDSFYNSSANETHIGVYGLVDNYGVENDTDFKNASDFVQMHEEMHRRCTANKPYAWGVQRGCELMLEYISSVEDKTKRRFRSQKDYEYYANQILPQRGIYINYNQIAMIVGGIMNSLEDGRIERIRSNRYPGFEVLRRVFRFRFWKMGEEKFPSYEKIKDNAAEKLRIITNQVLTLAKCQLFQKGFVMAYAGTPLMKETNTLMPYIAKAYISGTTRGMVMNGLEIVKLLAPYIYDACKAAAIDPLLKAMLEEMIKFIAANIENLETGLSEQEEDTDDGSVNTSFDQTDLVIEVDKETFEKLKNNTRSSEGGIKIKQKEDAETPESPKGENGTAPHGENSEKPDGNTNGTEGMESQPNDDSAKNETPASEPSETGNQGNAENTCPSETGEQNISDEPGKGAGKPDGADFANTSEDAGKVGESDSAEADKSGKSGMASEPMQSAASEAGRPDGNMPKGMPGEKKSPEVAASSQKSFEEQLEADLERQAEEAKNEASETAASDLETINQSRAHEYSRSSAKTVEDKESPLNQDDVQSILQDDVPFKELKRTFKLDTNLPPVIRERGRTLKRNNDKYFKSLSRPTVTHRESGSIDPGRIFGLAIGETDVFRKIGKDKKFDGCCYVLIDHSGSMQGDKHEAACMAAAIIEEGFKGIMPMKMVSFNWRGGVVHEVVKGWDEQQSKNCCWNYCVHSCPNGGNEDGYDIRIASSELLKRPERRKLLVVLSDGTPGNCSYTKDAIKKARRHGIQVAGIYFEEGTPDAGAFIDMYQKDYIICSPSEIVKNLISICKKFSRS